MPPCSAFSAYISADHRSVAPARSEISISGKFFHRPPGDHDRELLFIPGDEPIVMGIYMHEDGSSADD